jgi:sulfatase maturation enzyme AslB (radical SAM superfamily)
MRNYRGLDYNSGYPLTELSLTQFKHILRPDFLKQLSRGVSFNGNLGDFGLARDARKIVHYLLDQNIKRVYINTNGSMRTPEWWASLAHPTVEIGFALDGLADTHSLYRQDTDWQKVINNATAFIQAGGRAVWRFIPFDHNRHQEQDCIKLSKELGFSRFENIHEGRDRGPVFSRSGNFSHWLCAAQDFNPDMQEMVNDHITWFDHRTIKIAKDTPVLNISCHHKTQQEIYIAADGTVYPCCFLGFYPGQMTHPGNKQLIPLVRENNALEYDLEHCVAWFNSVEQTWSHSSINDGRLYQCVNSCNRV